MSKSELFDHGYFKILAIVIVRKRPCHGHRHPAIFLMLIGCIDIWNLAMVMVKISYHLSTKILKFWPWSLSKMFCPKPPHGQLTISKRAAIQDLQQSNPGPSPKNLTRHSKILLENESPVLNINERQFNPKGSFTYDVIQFSAFFTPLPLSSSFVINPK